MERKYIIITQKANAQCQSEPFDWETMTLKDNEAVIQTEMSMISAGTELSRVYEIKKGFSYPVYPGYTAIGRILAKGSGLHELAVGDRVFYSGCHASVNKFNHVATTQGNKIMKIDERLTNKQACLIQMGLIAMNTITACNGKITDTAAVYGLGTIGLVAAVLLKKAGLRVIGFDMMSSRCKVAEALGLEAYNCKAEEQVALLKKLTGGKGSDISVDASGISAAIVNAVLGAAKHGQVILLGSPRADYMCNITPMLNAIHMKMLEVKGAFNELNPYLETEGHRGNVLRDFETIQQLILDGTIDAEKIISHVIAPEEIMQAYEGLMYDKENWHCAVIDWSK